MYICTIQFSNLLIVLSQSYPALNLAFSLMHIILIFIITKVKIAIKGFVGQLGTGQFSIGQFGTKIIKRTIWHQDNKSRQFGTKIIKVDNLAPGQFGTKHLI